MNLIKENKVFGIITKVSVLILLALTICTCSGLRLTSGNQTFGKQIDYSIYSGKLARPIFDRTDCATLRIVDQAFPLWHQERWLTWQPYLATPDMVFYLSLDPMRKRCSQIKWYRYPLITHSFSNLSRTEWTVQRPSLPSASPRPSSQDGTLSVPTNPKPYRVSIPRSTGRTPVITPMMVRNSNSSSTMRVVSGNARTTSSTTGVLRKPPLD